ncbi:TolC family protein [Ralstonia sp. TCR112]|uniref:TolC family protein n=1 Tax=Ralstonia sp. TCR112 TaxID=2601730 RepID=UPI0011BEB87D|nr:TolC family protein [Ralstonia sp. TCR112]
MSGKVGERATKALLYGVACGFMSLYGNPASAWSWPARLDDPLYARPPVLDRGAVLPGDGQPIVCPSGTAMEHPLTLSEAVDLALCNNPQIKAAWAAIKIQAGAVGEARAAYLPTVTSTLSQLHTRNEFPGRPEANNSTDGHTLYAGLNWRIFDFGTRAANREAANALLVAAMTSHDAALQKTLAAVVGAYFDVLTSHAAVSARAEATKLAQDTLDATERREKKGAAGQSDTLQARTALAKAQLAEQRARADDNKAVAVLVYAVGLKPGAPIQLAETRDVSSTDGVGDLQGWLDDAMTRHPAIAAARAQLDAARAKVRQVRDEGLPTIDLTGNVYQNGYPNQGLQGTRSTVTTVGVTLTVPLFEGFARTYKVQGAAAQVEQSAAQYEDTEHQILSDVVKTHADAVSALSNLEASDTLLKSAQAALVSSERRYAKGAADILELLSTQSALSDALQERVRCVSEWRSARLRLMATAGVLGLANLQ